MTNGVLGQFDPTVLINDLYTIRLTVWDRGGNQSIAETTVQVDENLKVGNFSLSFTDLAIPMAGIPITVTRTYDSREKRSGDFGVGWRLDVQTLRLRANRVLGTGWQVLRSGLSYALIPTDAHTVSLTLPDGRVEQFDLVVSPDVSPIVPFPPFSQSLRYEPRPGTLGQLESLDDNNISILDPQPGRVELRLDNGGDIYDPQRFRYTAADGTQIDIHKTDGVERIIDPNGNTLTFSESGITHSAGKSVTFERDAQGRITGIVDPAGNAQTYRYDANGDLIGHTDPEDSTTTFRYDRGHYLLEIVNPDGTRAIRQDFDPDGRLVSSTDANGNVIEVDYDLAARRQVVTDRKGNATVYVTDERGNVIAETDAIGNTTTYTYDANNNQTSRTDALGHTRSYTYDARNNLLTRTDSLGNTTTLTYAPGADNLLSSTDALGNTTTFSYDARNNLLAITDALGNTTRHSYDAAGNRIATEDALGHVTSYAYDGSGNLIGVTDPLGNRADVTYDANGNPLTRSRTRTIPTGVETLTASNRFDKGGRLIERIDTLGNKSTDQYDLNGRLAARTDKNGNRVRFEYDARGNLVKIIHPDETKTRFGYDVEGNLTFRTDRSDRSTHYAYDALNRLVSTTYPDGAVATIDYDAAGRVVARLDALGNERTFAYDAGGRLISLTDALGNATTYDYDANGNQISMTDANGHTTETEYDPNNRPLKIVTPDDAVIAMVYDALGRKLSARDQAGLRTDYAYDAVGRLTMVTDALGQSTAYTYDEVGNRISQTDSQGRVTRFEYDGQGRTTRIIRPLGMSLTRRYDAVGNLVALTDFNGDTSRYAYDSDDRLVTKSLPDGRDVHYAYTPDGKRTSATNDRGVTSYRYDLRDRLIEQIEPDGLTLSYTYDANGNRTSVGSPSGTTTYTFDALNRLDTVRAPSGGVTTYTYDAAGNHVATAYPNGVTTSYTYDSLNRLLLLENRKPDASLISAYRYEMDATGKRTQVTDHLRRTTTYGYDTLHRLVSEVTRVPGMPDETVVYTYDAVGNRLSRTDSGGSALYTYDLNDRLLGDGANSFAYDANGNTLTQTNALGTTEFSYDFEDRLTVITKPDGAVIEYGYDVDGRRVESTQAGGVTRFLVDRNRPFAQVLEERTDDGTLMVSYEYGKDLIRQQRGGASRVYLYDGLGSTRQLADASGTITDTYDYDAFGVMRASTGATENAYLYAGEQFAAELDGYFLRARYYQPEQGRFLTTDPAPGDLDAPMSLHRYLYTEGDPVNYVDPTGESKLAQVLVGLAIGGIVLKGGLDVVNTLIAKEMAGVSSARELFRVLQVEAFAMKQEIARHDFENGPLPQGYPKRFKPGLTTKYLKDEHMGAWRDMAGLAANKIDFAYAANAAAFYKNDNRETTVPNATGTTAVAMTRAEPNEYALLVTNNFKNLDAAEGFGYQLRLLIRTFSNVAGYGDKYLNSGQAPQPIAVGTGYAVEAGSTKDNEYATHWQAVRKGKVQSPGD